jgi:hypothetical protein
MLLNQLIILNLGASMSLLLFFNQGIAFLDILLQRVDMRVQVLERLADYLGLFLGRLQAACQPDYL